MRLYQYIAFIIFLVCIPYATQSQTTWLDSLILHSKHDSKTYKIEYESDTLKITSGKDFCYHPFGVYLNPMDMNRSMKSIFQISIMRVLPYCDHSFPIDTMFRLTYKNSSVDFLYLNVDEEKHKTMVLHRATITDPRIRFVNGIKPGMSRIAFWQKILSSPMPVAVHSIKTIQVSRALEGLWYFYDFKDDIVSRITIKSDHNFCEQQ